MIENEVWLAYVTSNTWLSSVNKRLPRELCKVSSRMAGERGSFQTDKTTKTAMLSHRAPSLRTNKNIKTYWFWKQTSCENTTNTIRVFVSRSSFPQPLSISNRLTHPYRSPQRPTSGQSSTSRSIPFV